MTDGMTFLDTSTCVDCGNVVGSIAFVWVSCCTNGLLFALPAIAGSAASSNEIVLVGHCDDDSSTFVALTLVT